MSYWIRLIQCRIIIQGTLSCPCSFLSFLPSSTLLLPHLAFHFLCFTALGHDLICMMYACIIMYYVVPPYLAIAWAAGVWVMVGNGRWFGWRSVPGASSAQILEATINHFSA